MGKVRWELLMLGVLLGSIFWMRMEISTNTESLTFDSYLTVRNVEHIKDTWLPLKDDPLSVTGAERVTNPVYDYMLAMAVWISPAFYKILPNFFMVLLLVPIYFLCMRLTKSFPAALSAVALAGLGPLGFSSYLNTPSSAPLALFLLLTILLMLSDTQKYLFHIVALSILLAFVSPLIFLLVFVLLASIALLRFEGFGVDSRLSELFFFSLLLSLWLYVIVYKQALFSQGIAVIWQNLPSEFASLSFRNITFLDAISGLGVVTFLLGTVGTYHALFETRERALYPIIGALIAVAVSLLLRLLPAQLGLLALSLLLAVLAGYGLLIIVRYLRLTKAPWIIYPFVTVVIVFFMFSSVLPALVNAKTVLENSPTSADIKTYEALQSLADTSVLLTPIDEGAAVQYYSGKKTLTDNDFLLVSNGEVLIDDVNNIYTSHFSPPVISRAARLGFTHILLSRRAALEYNRTSLYSEGSCISPRTIPGGTLYTLTCEAIE